MNEYTGNNIGNLSESQAVTYDVGQGTYGALEITSFRKIDTENNAIGGTLLTMDPDGSLNYLISIIDITSEEREQFDGEVRTKLLMKNDVIFLFIKIGDLPWQRAAFSVKLIPYMNPKMMEIPTEGFGINIILIEGSTCELVKLRKVALSTQQSKKLVKMMTEQLEMPFSKIETQKKIVEVIKKYPTKKLVKYAV